MGSTPFGYVLPILIPRGREYGKRFFFGEAGCDLLHKSNAKWIDKQNVI
jgi:hypothetical protein